MELSKDGRWMGGTTPTGFSSERVATGSGKNKSAVSFLVPIQEEKELIQELYATFLETRSLHATAVELNKSYTRRHEGLHVLYLELGVGANTPVIIKYPFWQMTMANDKAIYACLNYG